MDTNQKSRAELKAYFIRNAIPTQNHFHDLIDAALNKKDDGVVKSAGNPLCIEAQSSDEKPIIHLYDSFTSTTPSFVLSLLPGTTASGVTTGKGFSVGDGNGAAKARLFVDSSTGNVGIGTVSPGSYKLSVAGTLNVSSLLTASAGISVPSGQTVTLNGPVSATAGATISGGVLNANGGLTVPSGQTLTASGAISGASTATIAGLITANGGLTVPSGQTLTANGSLLAKSGAAVSGSALTASAGANISGALLTATAGATISGAVLTASAGISVPSGQTITTGGAITAGGLVTASAGLSVTTAALTASAGATISGAALNAQLGANVSGGLLTASAGATITGAALTVGSSATGQNLDVYGRVNANGGLTVPSGQTLLAQGTLTASGLITASAGLTIGASQPLTAGGAITASGLITASAGLTIGASQPLTAGGAITASGLITANAGLTLAANQALTAGGAITAAGLITANAGLTLAANQALNAGGAVTASGVITANAGLTIASNQALNAGGAITASGVITANAGLTIASNQALNAGGTITASGVITANNGITVPSGKAITANGTITAGGVITANAGITVPAGQALTANGTITAGGAITANAGLTIPSGQALTVNGTITAAGAITANGAITAAAAITANSTLTVSGLTTLGALKVTGTDIYLDNTTRRGTRTSGQRRAIIHDSDDSLYMNFAGDYTYGIKLGGQTSLYGPLWAWDNNIYLRSPGAYAAGVGYFGASRPFAGAAVDGPGLYGYAGGVLGTIRPAGSNVEGALVLNGGSSSGGYVTLPSMTDNFNAGVTVEAWVYLASNSYSYARILDFGTGPSANNLLFAQNGTSTTLRIALQTSTGQYTGDAAGVLTTGAWMHVAATIDSSGNIKIYKDGVSQTVTVGGTYTQPGSVTRTINYIGRSNWSADGYLGGKLAHVKLWTRALSADEIWDSYKGNRVLQTTNLVGWWPLDDAAGTSARDKSGQGRNGTLSASGASYVTYQSAALSWDSSNNVSIGNTLTVGGDATARGNSVVVGAEQLRIIRGSINSDGGISRGAGFTVSKAGTGLYDITWSTPYTISPTVVVTQHYPGSVTNTGGSTLDNAVIVGINTSMVRIKTGKDTGAAEDRNFSFLAIG